MDTFWRIIGLCMTGSMTALLLRREKAELSAVVSVLCCIGAIWTAAELIRPVTAFAHELQTATGLEPAILSPVLKAVGIGLLTELAGAFCADAGENALCKTVELCGGFLAAYTALPLARSVLLTVRQLMGG